MKIKVINAPPIDPKHGIKRGDIYDARWESKPDPTKRSRNPGAVIIRAAKGVEVTLLSSEFTFIPPKESP